MNLHNKLLKLGFRKTEPYKLDHDLYDRKFIPYSELKIVPPKWLFTYLYKFSNEIKIWVILEKHSNINIYVERPVPKVGGIIWRKVDSRVKNVYSSGTGKFPPLNSIGDILQFLPKEVKRDFVLDILFK